MGFWDIDYTSSGLPRILLPVRRRMPKIIALLTALLSPVLYVYNIFITTKNNIFYRLSHTGQVIVMTAALNDVFDPVDRGIYITDGPFKPPLYGYNIAENKPFYLGNISEYGTTVYQNPIYVYNISESVFAGVQFVVHVPTAVESLPGYSLAWLRSEVDEYRLPSKGNYNVVYF